MPLDPLAPLPLKLASEASRKTMSDLVSSHIQDARQYLMRRRAEIGQSHAAGATGAQVAAALTVMTDGMVTRLTHTAVAGLTKADASAFESEMALVALGGYGRAELSPFSDVDLMFLYRPGARQGAEELCNRLVRDLWDAGLVLGSSLRTLVECVTLARRDLSVHTALLEGRHILGSSWLTGELRERIERLTRGRRADRFVEVMLLERAAEQARFGSSAHLLEPNLKLSKGGLRELHLIRWIAHVRYGVAGFDRLEQERLLSAEDAAMLAEAREFILRARNDLHFKAGRAQDVLTLHEQVRLAAAFGFRDRPGLLAVEQFMQRFYRHSSALEEVAERFVRRCRGSSLWRRLGRFLTQRRVNGQYVVTGGALAPVPEARPAVLSNLERLVSLFSLANQMGLEVDDSLWEQIRNAVSLLDGQDATAARRVFLAMLATPGHLDSTVRRLASLGVLEKLIPEFAHARGLIQFNQYHKYTVDEHTLLCVAHAEAFQDDPGPLGHAYRGIHHKEILHLALILHDLGKGFEDDHSALGYDIALRTADRFGLEAHLRDILVFLVRHHLLMAHLAFRRDTSDEQLLARFARQVGTPEVLKMLFVLTAADIASVGPEAWTTWKADVLGGLYARTMEKLTGDFPSLHPDEDAAAVREQVFRSLAGDVREDWLQKHIESMTPHYLLSNPVERIIEHLRTMYRAPAGDVQVTTAYHPSTRVTAYTVYTLDRIMPGLFSKIAGVLAASGLQILNAQISTHQDGVVVDRFEAIDLDYEGEPPPARLSGVSATVRQVLLGQKTVESLFPHSNRIGSRYQKPEGMPQEPTQIQIDNDTSERFTILEVFANDRQGLLYVVARTIFELGLSVSLAKITTSLDQVLDVFYVTDLSGKKVTRERRLEEIRARLAESIEEFEAQSAQP